MTGGMTTTDREMIEMVEMAEMRDDVMIEMIGAAMIDTTDGTTIRMAEIDMTEATRRTRRKSRNQHQRNRNRK